MQEQGLQGLFMSIDPKTERQTGAQTDREVGKGLNHMQETHHPTRSR